MMSAEHPQHEDVMAFLDGELTAASELDIRAHLDTCLDCRSLAGDLRAVSHRLAAWSVEPVPATLDARVKQALRASAGQARDRRVWWRRMVDRGAPRWSLTLAGAAAAVLAVAVLWRTADTGRPAPAAAAAAARRPSSAVGRQELGQIRAGGAADAFPAPPPPPQFRLSDLSASPAGSSTLAAAETASADSLRADVRSVGGFANAPPDAVERRDLTGGLLIARTANVHLVVADVDQARAILERQLTSHQGYVSRLQVTGERPATRTLITTVKVPTDQVDATLMVVRSLGRVQDETRGSEDVTAQSVDLDARLANARRTEQRLVAVLERRTGKVSDVLEVEREIARVRSEIEQMEGARKRLTTRIDFATIELRLEEERRAGLTVSPPSVRGELRNAAVDGVRDAAQFTISLMLLMLHIGPTVALGAAALAWPLWALWRRRFRAQAFLRKS
jgi:hypothetical protein